MMQITLGFAEHSDKQDAGGQKAVEREDWPGPPEPAVAYPELCKFTELLAML